VEATHTSTHQTKIEHFVGGNTQDIIALFSAHRNDHTLTDFYREKLRIVVHKKDREKI
jgi:hypothetical protein